MRLANLSGALLLLMACAGCTDEPGLPPEPLDLPHWRTCAQSYGGDLDARFEARARGEEFAILCALTNDEGRDLPSSDLKNLYRIYRIRGREPERLDAVVRRFHRTDVWAMLLNVHDFSAELEAVDINWRGCPDFDPIARELLLRAEPGGDMWCVPRRYVFWG